MTAKISPMISKGTIKPVDRFAPKARAIRVTMIMAIPFIPAFEIPNTMAAVKASAQAVVVISKLENKGTKQD